MHTEMKNKIQDLTSPYYTRQNLGLVLSEKRRTLDYRLSALKESDILTTVKPGFYLNKQLLRQTDNKRALLEYVGCIAKQPSYVSLSYALAQYELIPESIYTISYITTKKTNQYSCSTVTYSYRNLKQELFKGFIQREFQGLTYFFALQSKALFDFIYLTPLTSPASFRELLFQSRLNWSNLTTNEAKKFAQFCLESNSPKMKKVVTLLQKEGKL